VLLVAPSGFGKTSLLAEWATTIGTQVAWLSCDETDGSRRTSGPGSPPASLPGLPTRDASRQTPGALHRVPLVMKGTAAGRAGVLSPEPPGAG
jgi:hypothetical protein